MKGRRHARRLQYIRSMPEEQRMNHLERIASGSTHPRPEARCVRFSCPLPHGC